ncbi:FAD-binding oxidoreductase [Aspergillus neoniger CBS 115656]|uniref:FAD binding domain protein n=1 Tax=Aspergillus neoniger (strain CBS 115656) TaxID=1448310 RepID=A0A318YIA0_ASPNB|nr:FAD binding domain protein [Aspergillus neoniger CBS 115656]PYH33477.1 FAD binding domain protein [Aspergillus neoniger CBS 115656]
MKSTLVLASLASSAFSSSLVGLGQRSINATSTTAVSTVDLETGARCACNNLAVSYSNLMIYPGSANYTSQVTNYWDIRADLDPACIFLPTSAEQVADAIGLFATCGAQFAVRGGGHMNYPGSNNIDGGVLLAFDNMKEYQVNNDTIDVAPGMTWYDVYSALDPYGRAAIGGRLKTIGVPGLTLIGGVSYFINKYGFAMDNVVNYDIVLGNGTQVAANATSHPDLFWALKGGANNFGVVTKFTLKTYSMPHISTTIQEFNETAVHDFIKASCDWVVADSDTSIAAGSVLTITYNATTGSVSPLLLGVQEGISNPPSKFTNFTAIPGVYKVSNVTTSKHVTFGHHSMYPDSDVLYSMYQTWKAAVNQIADVQGLYPTFVINISPASAVKVGNTNGIGNVWGLAEEPTICDTGWDNAEDDLRVEAWVRQLVEHLHGINKCSGLARDFIYMGDGGDWQDPFAGFPGENVQRMREIRERYDPLGTFTRLNWGGFKLGN